MFYSKKYQQLSFETVKFDFFMGFLCRTRRQVFNVLYVYHTNGVKILFYMCCHIETICFEV